MIADFEYLPLFLLSCVRKKLSVTGVVDTIHSMQEKLQGLEISMSAYYLSCKKILINMYKRSR